MPIDTQRIVLSAELEGRGDPQSPSASIRSARSERAAEGNFGQIALADGQLTISPSSSSSPASATLPSRAEIQAEAMQGLDAAASADHIELEGLQPELTATREAEIASVATVARAALTPRPWKSQRVEVRKGDSLTTVLKRAGVDGRQVHSALSSLKGVYDPRNLRAGQELTVTAATREEQPAHLLSVALDLDFDHQLVITRDADGSFSTKTIEQAKRRELVHRSGDIEGSLYLSTRRESVPGDVTDRLIRLFSWDVDFQRDIRRNDRFETLYEEVSLEKDQSQVKGELIYAGLTLRGELIDAYLFTPDGGLHTYYDRNGRSLRKFLLRTPIDGARLSSHFGKRRHPVLGYTKMHKGTDFAAPRGTPIYAAGSGRIEKAEPYGGFGNYIRIRHSDTWSTAYAHMHNFAKGIRPGVRVRQGDVIGYVGTTGRSTGNHLHYEVLKNNKQINPMKMKQPSAASLKGEELIAFKRERDRIDAARERLSNGHFIASRDAAASE
jgi:murein DD-endopeptidase MepM/ murein hydrolase activator NlpD